MIFRRISDLPESHRCKLCGVPKPIAEMILFRRRSDGSIYLRSRCKSCNNGRERGHRREWKRAYLRRWRIEHCALNESYWRQRNAERRQELAAYARERFEKNHAAILVQGRLRRHGIRTTLAEARRLVAKFGPAYPSRFGLTEEGRREAERIRSRLRNSGQRPDLSQIRLMVYEDGLHINPKRQSMPYQHSSEQLKAWWAERRASSDA